MPCAGLAGRRLWCLCSATMLCAGLAHGHLWCLCSATMLCAGLADRRLWCLCSATMLCAGLADRRLWSLCSACDHAVCGSCGQTFVVSSYHVVCGSCGHTGCCVCFEMMLCVSVCKTRTHHGRTETPHPFAYNYMAHTQHGQHHPTKPAHRMVTEQRHHMHTAWSQNRCHTQSVGCGVSVL